MGHVWLIYLAGMMSRDALGASWRRRLGRGRWALVGAGLQDYTGRSRSIMRRGGTVTQSEPRWLEVASAQVAYLDEGTGAVTVLAVPGLPGSSRDFRHLAARLSAAAVRVIRVDLPGYGRSPRTRYAGMDTDGRARVLADLVARLDLGSVALMGHSMGCPVVARLAAEQPRMVSHVIMLAPPGPQVFYPQRAMRTVAPVVRQSAGRWVLRPLIRAAFSMQGFPRYVTDDELAFTLLDDAACDFVEYARALGELVQPTLLTWAKDDRNIPADRFEAVARIVPPGPRVVYPSGGHAVQKENADDLARRIGEFVRSN